VVLFKAVGGHFKSIKDVTARKQFNKGQGENEETGGPGGGEKRGIRDGTPVTRECRTILGPFK